MNIRDNIYGEFDINEPVLTDLLNSPSMLRLKKISQFGIPDKYYILKNFDRYEHSVGVMLLLRKLGASLEEQAAGLLHDVSVLAFSHITDWVFGQGRQGKEDYHDGLHQDFIRSTEIPGILAKHGFDVNKISDLDNFSLLENNSPDLCADRVDYALREFKYWLNPAVVDNCIAGLIDFNGEMVFDNSGAAHDFANNYLQLQMKHWGRPDAVLRYHLFSNALKIAIDKGYINESDFYNDEELILNKMRCGDKEIEAVLASLETGSVDKYKNNSGQKVLKKFRFVDPKVKIGNDLVRLSAVKSDFSSFLEECREINQKGVMI